ncbi:proprotein convertase subtilisin/kexin type 6 isoform X3 [Hydra vulgaris]|uniref:Proprotein convertase subtilisin/kexin type 6 isoform X3 n=1 Tax=Hydra vulgaris TaxID=6087 RepID=A0ABM4DDP9_HYDVU
MHVSFHTLTLIIATFMLLILPDPSYALKKKNSRSKKDKNPPKSVFINTWAVVVNGNDTMATKVAGENGFINLGKVFENVYQFIHRGIPKRLKRASFSKTIHLNKDKRVAWAQQQELKIRVKRSISFNDVWWRKQWYLYRQDDDYFGHDLNLLPVWRRGITGKGVVISILDDGIEHTHPELKGNYDSRASFDFNSNDTDPSPRSNWREDNRHGTRCAGVAAAVANNSNCIVGVAYEARIGGIRMLDGEITDLIEAQSLSHERGYIDIYSSSWGPQDDGETVEGPGFLTQIALEFGAKYGRQGKGSIVVWASGNGGKYHDNCNCDGYTNSIYTISVSAVSSVGAQPLYSESCASTLVSAYSSGTTKFDRRVMTTDLNQGCTDSHTGTSVSPPIIAGLIALALQVNPKLTWRDVQHILIESSKLDKLLGDDFKYNGAGKQFSHHFGFGIVNAENLVDIAEGWTTVGEQHSCYHQKKNMPYPHNRFNNSFPIVLQFNTTACSGTSQVVNFVEHVHVVATFYHYRRGATEISVVSPSGTESWILKERKMDIRDGEFKNWKFLSNHFWGEKPNGLWKINFISRELDDYGQGFLKDVELIIYGTEHQPQKFKKKSVKLSYSKCHILCDRGCAGVGPHNCVTCKGYFYKSSDIKYCVESCPIHMYTVGVSHECLPCHSSCLSCENGNQSNCLTCPIPTALLNGRCVQHCPLYMFKYADVSGNFVCQNCGSLCRTCKTHTDWCTSCENTNILVEGKCIPKCNEGEWFDSNVCQPCHSSCKTCNGGSYLNCSTCPKTSFNDEEDRYLYNGRQCVLNCPVRTYHANTIAGDCLDCPENCLQCSNEGRKCDICSFDYFRVSGEGNCVKFCPQGYYTDMVTRMCESCGHQCESCVPGNSAACTSCFNGYFLKGHECVSKLECQSRYYVDVTTGKCELCPINCSFCENANVCTACFLNYYLTTDKQCLHKCPSGTYGVESPASCVKCSKSCQECNGPTVYECTVCSQGKHLFHGRCVEEVPVGYFARHDGISSVCEPCHHTCHECLGPDNCISCIGELDNRNKGCVNPCPNQYLSQNNCQSCHPGCSSCFGPNYDQCIECNGNFSLHTDTHTCHKVCQRKFYNDEKTLTCKPCHSSCASCVGPSFEQCLTCIDKLYFLNNTCVSQCPLGWFKTFDHACARCSSRCNQCIYNFDLCTSCGTNEVWHDFKCYSACPAHMFKDKSNRCYQCHDSCNTCVGASPNQCLTCRQGFSIYNGMCIEGCTAGFFYSSLKNKCLPCNGNCLRCNELYGKIFCTKCNNSTYLQPNGICSHQCPLLYYRYPKDNVCMKCNDKSCLACEEDSGACILCPPMYDLVNGICKGSCPMGTFYNKSDYSCSSCDLFCRSCNDTRYCNSCEDNYFLFVSNEGKHLCVQSCPEGYYEKEKRCQPCNDQCLKCNSSSCHSCIHPSVLFNSTCITNCPLGYIRHRQNNVCESCDLRFVGCLNCNDKICIQCRHGFYMFNRSCLTVCPSGFVLSSGACQPCNKFHSRCIL